MENEKCFCHLNGYAVKDATARKTLEDVVSNIDSINEGMANILETQGIYVIECESYSKGEQEYIENDPKYIKIAEKINEGSQPIILLYLKKLKTIAFLCYADKGSFTSGTEYSFESVNLVYCGDYSIQHGNMCSIRVAVTITPENTIYSTILHRRESDAKIITDNNAWRYGYLKTNNGNSYDVVNDYQPAHKQYVDTAISNALSGGGTGGGGSAPANLEQYGIYRALIPVSTTNYSTSYPISSDELNRVLKCIVDDWYVNKYPILIANFIDGREMIFILDRRDESNNTFYMKSLSDGVTHDNEGTVSGFLSLSMEIFGGDYPEGIYLYGLTTDIATKNYVDMKVSGGVSEVDNRLTAFESSLNGLTCKSYIYKINMGSDYNALPESFSKTISLDYQSQFTTLYTPYILSIVKSVTGKGNDTDLFTGDLNYAAGTFYNVSYNIGYDSYTRKVNITFNFERNNFTTMNGSLNYDWYVTLRFVLANMNEVKADIIETDAN